MLLGLLTSLFNESAVSASSLIISIAILDSNSAKPSNKFVHVSWQVTNYI